MAYVTTLDENGNPIGPNTGTTNSPGSGVVVSTSGGPAVSSKGGGTTGTGPGQTSQNANPSTPSSSGQFTNINAYLAANPTGAAALGDTLSNTINTSTKNASDTINNANTAFGNAVNAGTDVYDPNLVSSAIKNPTSFVNNNTDLTTLAQMRAGTYNGPTDYSQSSDAQRALAAQANANETANLGTTAAGREELLQQQPGQATGAGGLNLNQFLVQNTPGALDKVTGAATNETGTINPQFSAGETGAGNTVTAGQTKSTAAGNQTTAALNQGLTDYRNTIAAQVAAANAKTAAAQTAAENAINGIPAGASSSTGGGPKASIGPQIRPGTATAQSYTPPLVNPNGSVNNNIIKGGTGVGGAHTNSVAPQALGGILGTSGLKLPVSAQGGILANSGIGAKPTATSPTGTATTTPGTKATALATLSPAVLAQLGLTQAQWNNLQTLQNEAMQYGGGINAGNYLTTVAPTLGAAQATDSGTAANYNALQQIAGGTPDTSTLATSGGAGSQTFNIAGATAALQAQIDAGKSQAQLQGASNQAASEASAAEASAGKTRQEIGVVGGVVAGAEIGGAVFDGIGAVVGGVIGGIVGIFSCFANGTKIKMFNGTFKNVEDIRVGDVLAVGGACFQKGVGLCNQLYLYKGVKIAGGHTVLEDDKWIHVRDSKLAKQLPLLSEFVQVHFLSTFGSRIQLENFLATDFQETLDEDLVMRHEQERVDLLNATQLKNKAVA